MESRMSVKERLILALIMSSMMVAVVTLVATWLNGGLRNALLLQWATAYIIVWPVAALTGFRVLPMSRRLTARILAVIRPVA
jgi:hypothetical protein